MSLQTAEVVGVITNTKFVPDSQVTEFKIHCPKMNKTFDSECSFYCPIRKGDTMFALCYLDAKQKLYVAKPPYIQQGLDKESVISVLIKILKNYFQTVKFYEKVSRLAGGDELVIAYLSELAQDWNDTRNRSMFELFGDTDQTTVSKVLEWWHKDRNLRSLYLLGLTKKEIESSRLSCKELHAKCTENPFSVPVIPLEKCEDILARLKKPVEPEERERGLVVRTVWNNMIQNAWTCTPVQVLVRRHPGLATHLPVLEEKYGIIVEDNCVYLKHVHSTEVFVSEYLIRKVQTDKGITSPEPVFELDLSDEQKKAVHAALDHNICIITAAAGCGKTTCIKEIVSNLERRKVNFAIVSFTGKAVARIREVTSESSSSSTIHRLISKATVSTPTHIIIDEISMVTTELFFDLIKTFPKVEKLTLVGDTNQLQPIGWGSLFQELLKSGTIPTYKLSKNFRVYTVEGETDGIILNANAIIQSGRLPLRFVETTNFNVLEGSFTRVQQILEACRNGGVKANQLVILTPYNKDLQQLNSIFQTVYNPSGKFVIDDSGVKWTVGDKVMLTENNYEINIFNGESGVVTDVGLEGVTVDFGGTEHDFLLRSAKKFVKEDDTEGGDKERTVSKLTHSYALTVDKSQGSEWDFVIFFVSEFNLGSFLNRSRVYTAITRAKRCLWAVVKSGDLFSQVATRFPPHRCDNLAKKLSSVLPPVPVFSLKLDAPELEMFNDIPDTDFDPDDF